MEGTELWHPFKSLFQEWFNEFAIIWNKELNNEKVTGGTNRVCWQILSPAAPINATLLT